MDRKSLGIVEELSTALELCESFDLLLRNEIQSAVQSKEGAHHLGQWGRGKDDSDSRAFVGHSEEARKSPTTYVSLV